MGISSIEAFKEEGDQPTEFGDEVSGKKFDPRLFNEARKEEILEFVKHWVYVNGEESECSANTGKAPIGAGWIDV